MIKGNILCVIDVYNWAMHNRFLALKKYLGNEYSFDVILASDLQRDHFKLYNIVYCLNWVLHKNIANLLPSPDKRTFKLVTTVCSHRTRNNPAELAEVFKHYDKISASSAFLFKELKPLYNSKMIYTPFGVDNTVFKKDTPNDLYSNKFGFVGKTNRPLKRFSEVNEAVNGSGAILKVVNHKSNFDRQQMVKFYNSIGTVICFSETEGTPNPALEAAACSRAIISTPVGNIPELFGDKYPLSMVTSKAEMEKQISLLMADKKLLNDCGSYLEERIRKDWNWSKMSENFMELF